MADEKKSSSTMENPTLVLKLSAILGEPWNNELRSELMSAEAIARLRGTPVQVVAGPEGTRSAWSTQQIVDAYGAAAD